MESNRLKYLLRAYVQLVQAWGKGTPGENMQRLWKATQFLEKMIRKEVEK